MFRLLLGVQLDDAAMIRLSSQDAYLCACQIKELVLIRCGQQDGCHGSRNMLPHIFAAIVPGTRWILLWLRHRPRTYILSSGLPCLGIRHSLAAPIPRLAVDVSVLYLQKATSCVSTPSSCRRPTAFLSSDPAQQNPRHHCE